MNVREYISSGIVESYVLGLLPEAERKSFESLCEQYPEIVSARDAFELSLEEQLLSDVSTTAPPLHVKKQIEEKLVSGSIEEQQETIEEDRPTTSVGIWKWLAAASMILLAGAAYWAITTNTKYNELQAKNKLLQDSIAAATQNASVSGPAPKSAFKIAVIREGSTAAASIYWDTVSKDAYLMINDMPPPPSDKQYQLWAFPGDNEQPVDLGMIELKHERVLHRMKNVQNASAFAITVEPKGGSPQPTSTPMVSTQPVNL